MLFLQICEILFVPLRIFIDPSLRIKVFLNSSSILQGIGQIFQSEHMFPNLLNRFPQTQQETEDRLEVRTCYSFDRLLIHCHSTPHSLSYVGR